MRNRFVMPDFGAIPIPIPIPVRRSAPVYSQTRPYTLAPS
ncbi:hypothetical protein L1278_000179 [Pontibacter sp. HSC-36F09]|nr:hypothetical protein [Pontibacter sp. HSC-36F09]